MLATVLCAQYPTARIRRLELRRLCTTRNATDCRLFLFSVCFFVGRVYRTSYELSPLGAAGRQY
jgi:hypothetical protein